MKMFLASILFSLLVSLTTIAQTVYTDAELIQKLANIGEIHNNGLDFEYSQLKKKFGSTYNGGRTESERITMKSFLEDNSFNFTTSTLKPNDNSLTSVKNRTKDIDYRVSSLDLVSQLKNQQLTSNLSILFISKSVGYTCK